MSAENTSTPERRVPGDLSSSLKLLGYGGLIPFFAAAIAAWIFSEPVFGIDPMDAGRAYGAVILSFLGGIRWGLALTAKDGADRDLMWSVVPSLAGWIALIMPAFFGVPLLLIGFLAQLNWDMTSSRAGRFPAWFISMRMHLTFGAVLSLVALLPLAGMH